MAGRKASNRVTVADALVRAAKASGTRRLFGLPGGGSSLDVMESARRQGLDFILTRHECGAVFMAAATATLDGALGVAVTTKGPGTANGANGAAQASLDRCAVAIVTDGFSPKQRKYITHQWFDQKAMLAPVVKAHSLLDDAKAGADIDRLVTAALTPRRGPVHVELTGPAARTLIRARKPRAGAPKLAPAPRAAIERARSMIARAKRPVIVAGLEACDRAAAAALRRLVAALDCPALVTYQAKGVLADGAPQTIGIFTGGLAEQPTVKQADLIILAGLDPVELILQPWPYAIPVLDIGYTKHPVHYVKPKLGVYGDLAKTLAAVRPGKVASAWGRAEMRQLRDDMRASLAYRGRGGGLTPQQVVEEAAAAAKKLPLWPRATVDAGAHMFSATAFWPCTKPNDVLISNGLATMGFALPAAIASALHEPQRATVAFTGDGGLMMCMGELATAVQERARIVVVVFNDGALSLIDIKQQSRQLPVTGVRWKRLDFAAAMRGMGGRGYRARTLPEYRRALARALAGKGPALVDVQVDPSGYQKQLRAMRG